MPQINVSIDTREVDRAFGRAITARFLQVFYAYFADGYKRLIFEPAKRMQARRTGRLRRGTTLRRGRASVIADIRNPFYGAFQDVGGQPGFLAALEEREKRYLDDVISFAWNKAVAWLRGQQ